MPKPVAVVLDTNLISGQAKQDVPWGELGALDLLYENAPSNLTIWATTNARDELSRVPPEYRQDHMEVFQQYREMPGYPSADPTRLLNVDEALSTEAGDTAYRSLSFLPDEPDRRLIAGAAQVGAPYFATVDVETILRYKAKIEAVTEVKARQPTEIVHELGLARPSTLS